MEQIFKDWAEFAPELPSGINEANIPQFRRKQYGEMYSSSVWYSDLEEFVLSKWVNVPLPIEEAKTLVKILSPETVENGRLGNDDLATVEKLASRITGGIAKLGGEAVVRLNNTSSNDLWSVGIRPLLVPGLKLENEKMHFVDPIQDIFVRKLKSIAPDDDDAQVLALCQAFQEGVKVTDGYEAVRNIISSFRCMSEIMRSIEYPEVYKTSIILRQYRRIDPRKQFRGFVHNHQLNAVSQLLSNAYFPDLEDDIPLIRDAISSLHEATSAKVPYKSYVLDIAMSGKKAFIMDIKPWMNDVESMLFSWKERVMRDGPLEIRVRTRPISSNNLHFMPIHWKRLANVYRKSMGVPEVLEEDEEGQKGGPEGFGVGKAIDTIYDSVTSNPVVYTVALTSAAVLSASIAVGFLGFLSRRR